MFKKGELVIIVRETTVGGRTLKVTLGMTARQADGAAWVQYGETVLHVTAVSKRKRREGMDFLPLTVDFREKFYAAGKIPGGFLKREGRPHDNEILNARIIDRPIRPLFPEGYAYETQVMAAVLSADRENEAGVLGPIAASIALNISDIPMNEAIASVRVGLIDGEYVINPTLQDIENSRLNLFLVGSADAITMVEGHADELSNQELIDALFFGHKEIKEIVKFIKSVTDECKKPNRDFELPTRDPELIKKITDSSTDKIKAIAVEQDKQTRGNLVAELEDSFLGDFESDQYDEIATVKATVDNLLKKEVRTNILEKNLRLDGRCNTDIRNIDCMLGILPRAHGSAFFTRGQTQSLGTVTLGTKLDEQRLDSLDVDGFRRYMLHYNFPPFCTGEVKNFFSTSRREIGHGNLGERAIQPVLPEWTDFPYTIRIVSEIMESNGSSSMATVCSGSLALMDAGVPIKKPVAGIAMGLIKEGDDYKILTDILGDEDHLGDMDFKVAGTRDGITAFQMDIKIEGITAELMAEALEHAQVARFKILDIMDATIDKPRENLSAHAPKFIVMKISVDRIGALIGPGGKIIREIIADTGATIDVEDDGTVRIGADTQEAGNKARARVEAVTEVPVEGKIYKGIIKRIMNFGAFVEIIPGVEGLMHISEIEHYRINRVEDVLQIGDEVEVLLQKLEPGGKMDLSRKALLPNDHPPQQGGRPPYGGGGGDDNRGGGRPGGGYQGGGGRPGGGRPGGSNDRGGFRR